MKTEPTISGEKRLTQIEVFPQRLLNIESAQTLLNELNKIDGIKRMVVYGPRLPKGNPEDLLEGRFDTGAKKYLNIMGEQVELTVQVGRVWIEVTDISAIEKIRKACEKTMPVPFEINEGTYIRTQKTITDYVRKGGKVDDVSVGMFDPKAKPAGTCCTARHVDE
ncbi:MAG TPA: methyl-coenzyme M reductase operon protein D [Methanocella sp.]|jgi:methyl-coenzyme M reductase subunit D